MHFSFCVLCEMFVMPLFCVLGSVCVRTVGTKFTQAMVKPWLKLMER